MADNESDQGNGNDGAGSRPPGEVSGERRYTKAEVESIVQGRIKESKAERESAAATLAAKEREAAEASLRVNFLRDVARRGMDLDIAEDLFESYRAKPADDRPTWLDKMSGVLKGNNNATQPKQPASEPAKAAVSASDKGSPAAPPADVDGLSNLNDMTAAQWEREVSRHGLAEAQRRLRAAADRWLSGVRIKLT